MTDEERTHLLHAATRQMDDHGAHLSIARDIVAMLLRILPGALDMLDASRGDLDTLRGLLGRLVQEQHTDVEDQKDEPV